MEHLGLLIIPLFLGLVVLFVVVSIRQAKRRRAELAAFAASRGLRLEGEPPGRFLDPFDGLEPFGRGSGRRASNLIRGRAGEIDWEAFDYRFSTGSGKNRRTHHYGVVVGRLPLAFPRLSIRPEGMFDRVASMLGFDDINFESEAFSSAYHVTGDDRRRVYDLVHPQMIEYLLAQPPRHWQLRGGMIVLMRSGRYAVGELGAAMAAVEGFVALVPEYVRQDLRAGGAPRAPGGASAS